MSVAERTLRRERLDPLLKVAFPSGGRNCASSFSPFT